MPSSLHNRCGRTTAFRTFLPQENDWQPRGADPSHREVWNNSNTRNSPLGVCGFRRSQQAVCQLNKYIYLHLEYLPHHPLGLAEVHAAEQNVVVQDVVDIVNDLPLLVALRQRPLLLVPVRVKRRTAHQSLFSSPLIDQLFIVRFPTYLTMMINELEHIMQYICCTHSAGKPG